MKILHDFTNKVSVQIGGIYHCYHDDKLYIVDSIERGEFVDCYPVDYNFVPDYNCCVCVDWEDFTKFIRLSDYQRRYAYTKVA